MRTKFSIPLQAAAATLVFCFLTIRGAFAGDIHTGDPWYLTDDLADRSFEVEVGAWKLVPSLSTSVEYNDNIIESPSRKRDFVPGATASLELKGDVGGIDTRLTGSIYVIRPLKTPSENDYEGDLSLDLRKDLSDALSSRLKIEFADLKPGFSTDSLDHEQTVDIKPSVTFEKGKYKIELRGGVGWDRFPGAVDGDGNPTIDTRQHRYASLELIASRKITEKIALYVGAILRGAIFDQPVDSDGYRRGSLGYGVFAGLRGDLFDKLSADLAVGVVRQTFKDVDFPKRDYFSVNGSLQWKPSDKIRVTVLAGTGFDEAEDYGAAGILSYDATLRGEYQATEKMVLVAEASYERAEYLYADIIERTADISTGFDYAVAKHGVLSVRYKYRLRRSDDPDEAFDRNAVYAAIRFN